MAVKMLSPATRAFQDAAETAAQLDHENILPIYDYGQHDDIWYRITQLVEQGTLEDRLDEGYSPQEALDILRPIADALNYAHGLDIIHGSLTASNVLIDAREKPLLTDFGFADLASKGAEPGAYVSSEQLSGGDIDRRTDVFGLGLLLYEILVEERMAGGSTSSPRLIRPDLAPAVEKVILKAMTSALNLRYQTVSDFIQALEHAVTPAPSPTAAAVPSGATVDELRETAQAPVSTEPGPDRSWLVLLLGGLFVVILAFALINLLGGDDGSTTDQVPTEAPVVQPTTPPDVQPTEEPTTTENPQPTAEPTTVAPTRGSGRFRSRGRKPR